MTDFRKGKPLNFLNFKPFSFFGNYMGSLSLKQKLMSRLNVQVTSISNYIDYVQVKDGYIFLLYFNIPTFYPRSASTRKFLNYNIGYLRPGFSPNDTKIIFLNEDILDVQNKILPPYFDFQVYKKVVPIKSKSKKIFTKIKVANKWLIPPGRVKNIVSLNSSYSVVFRIFLEKLPSSPTEKLYVLYDCNCMDYHFSGARYNSFKNGQALLGTRKIPKENKNKIFCKHISFVGDFLKTNQVNLLKFLHKIIGNHNSIT
jgi:hypothetical protein